MSATPGMAGSRAVMDMLQRIEESNPDSGGYLSESDDDMYGNGVNVGGELLGDGINVGGELLGDGISVGGKMNPWIKFRKSYLRKHPKSTMSEIKSAYYKKYGKKKGSSKRKLSKRRSSKRRSSKRRSSRRRGGELLGGKRLKKRRSSKKRSSKRRSSKRRSSKRRSSKRRSSKRRQSRKMKKYQKSRKGGAYEYLFEDVGPEQKLGDVDSKDFIESRSRRLEREGKIGVGPREKAYLDEFLKYEPNATPQRLRSALQVVNSLADSYVEKPQKAKSQEEIKAEKEAKKILAKEKKLKEDKEKFSKKYYPRGVPRGSSMYGGGEGWDDFKKGFGYVWNPVRALVPGADKVLSALGLGYY
jgi:hypothetical protein